MNISAVHALPFYRDISFECIAVIQIFLDFSESYHMVFFSFNKFFKKICYFFKSFFSCSFFKSLINHIAFHSFTFSRILKILTCSTNHAEISSEYFSCMCFFIFGRCIKDTFYILIPFFPCFFCIKIVFISCS